MKKPKSTKIKYAEIIERLVESQRSRSFWGKETKFLKSLIEKYPNMDFWRIYSIKPKAKTLLEFHGWPLKEKLEFDYKSFNAPKLYTDVEYTLDKKVGPDIITKRKPRTIREFLSNAAKKEGK